MEKGWQRRATLRSNLFSPVLGLARAMEFLKLDVCLSDRQKLIDDFPDVPARNRIIELVIGDLSIDAIAYATETSSGLTFLGGDRQHRASRAPHQSRCNRNPRGAGSLGQQHQLSRRAAHEHHFGIDRRSIEW